MGKSDEPSLRLLCDLADMAESLRADAARMGLSHECRGRTYSHPSLAAPFEVQKMLTTGPVAFGLTPRDRGKLGAAEPAPASKLELLQMRLEARPNNPAS
jgi:hypothetical protein